MVDTNIFDHIYNNNLAAKVKNFVDNGIISVFATSVQWDELGGMSDIKVKSTIENMMRQTLSLKTIPYYLSFVSDYPEEPQRPGFQRSRVGGAAASDLDEDQIKELKSLCGPTNGRNPIGTKRADIMIIATAMKNDMDFAVTKDEEWKKLVEELKRVLRMPGSRMEVVTINKKDLILFLSGL
jgi:hypothetical protein